MKPFQYSTSLFTLIRMKALNNGNYVTTVNVFNANLRKGAFVY